MGRGFLLRGYRTSCLSLAQSEGQGGCCQSWQNQRFWEEGLWIQVWRGALLGSHSNISNTWWLCSYMLETAHLLRNFGRGDLSPVRWQASRES